VKHERIFRRIESGSGLPFKSIGERKAFDGFLVFKGGTFLWGRMSLYRHLGAPGVSTEIEEEQRMKLIINI
jgi:hypothetical protein